MAGVTHKHVAKIKRYGVFAFLVVAVLGVSLITMGAGDVSGRCWTQSPDKPCVRGVPAGFTKVPFKGTQKVCCPKDFANKVCKE